jgi:sugar lactone lactonase YvrE
MQLSFVSKGKNIFALIITLLIFTQLIYTQNEVKAKAAVTLPLFVTVEQDTFQTDPSTNLEVKFIATFSEPIDTASFDSGDINLTGTAINSRVINLTETAPLNGTRYEFITRSDSSGTVIATVPQGTNLYNSAKFADTGTYPLGIAIDPAGNIYTANLTEASITKISPSGVPTTIPTQAGAGNHRIALDSSGNIYTTDYGYRGTSKTTTSGVSAEFGSHVDFQNGIVIDTFDNVYTVGNFITKTTPAGVSTQSNNTPGNAISIALDTSGNIYTTNLYTNNVSKIQPNGTVSTFANTGIEPIGITFFRNTIYVSNRGSNFLTKILADGTSSNFGSLPSGSSDVKADSSGNIYSVNLNGTVSLTTPDGVSKVVGTTELGPNQLVLDPQGNIYVTNEFSNSVSKITKTNNLSNGVQTTSGKINKSSTSVDNSVTIPQPPTPPPAPGPITLINGSDTGPYPNDFVTNNSTPSLKIICNPGYNISVSDGDAVLFGGLCSQSGYVQFQISGSLYEGTHNIIVSQFDSFGQYTFATNPLTITIDISTPDAPQFTVPTTSLVSTPTITGICEANQLVTLLISPTNESINTNCTAQGSFSAAPITPIPVGNFSVLATQTDLAGNTSRSFSTGGIIVQSATNLDRDGDGLSNDQEIIYGTDPDLVDTDGDGTTDFIEFNGPNNGDFNQNGVADGTESYISGSVGANGNYIGMQINGRICAQINSSTTLVESTLSNLDNQYKYPNGLIDFTINCRAIGGSVGVALFFFNQTDSPDLKVRKFINGSYSDLTEATKTQLTISITPTIKVSYDIIDGGSLDSDGVANGVITDPVGLALLDTPILPTNGENTTPAIQNNTSIANLIRTGGR